MTTRTEKSSKQFYEKDLTLNAPEHYERYFVPVIGKPVAEELIRLAEIRPNDNVLDIACGTGIVARLAAQQIGEKGSVSGLDINAGMLEVARSITSQDLSVEYIEANAESIPLSNESFDVVLCQLSLQFMEDKLAALKEMHRVMRSDGRLFLNIPGSAGELFKIFAEEMGRHISAEAAGFINRVFSLNDTNELRRLLTDANFRRIDINEEIKTLKLPAPKDFLWQYIQSTPIVEIISKATTEEREALERGIIEKWRKFQVDGSMNYQQRIISASGRK